MVLGNHDDKAAFRAGYLGEDASDAPYREVSEIDGLRLVTLDTSVSYQHGGIVDADHVDWLADVLATRAQNGTLLFGHHPFGISWKPQLEKAETHPRLAEVLAASDVRAIFNGHLHMPVASMAFDIPQFTAAPLSFGILRNGEQLWDTDRLGYSSVEVTPDGVSVQPEILHPPRVHIIGPNDMWEEYENQAQLWAQQKEDHEASYVPARQSGCCGGCCRTGWLCIHLIGRGDQAARPRSSTGT